MPLDQAALADAVVLTVKAALTPIMERLAAAEQCNKELQARVQELAGLRDRVVTVETKSAIPPASDPALAELRDRLLSLETKAETDPLAEVRFRLSTLESRPLPVLETKSDDVLRDRLLSAETSTAAVKERCAEMVESFKNMLDLRDRMIERLAVLETRAQIPGPPGKDGKDGADGLGFEDMDVEFDGDRTITIKAERGHLKKSWPITLPYLRQQGVYIEGKSYTHGDVVTWGGSQWHCNEDTTTKPGEGLKAWTLIVKRGRDGKDGRDGRDAALPVVSVGRPT